MYFMIKGYIYGLLLLLLLLVHLLPPTSPVFQ
jgi:hypothetical protein